MGSEEGCRCECGPVGIIRGLGEAGVQVQDAVEICRLYYAFQARDGSGSGFGSLGESGVHEQAFGGPSKDKGLLGASADGRGGFVVERPGVAPVDGGSWRSAGTGSGSGRSLVSSSQYTGLSGLVPGYSVRGPNYLRNQRDRLKKTVAKRERMERSAEERGRRQAVAMMRGGPVLTEDEKLLKQMRVRRLLAEEQQKAAVVSTALTQEVVLKHLADIKASVPNGPDYTAISRVLEYIGGVEDSTSVVDAGASVVTEVKDEGPVGKAVDRPARGFGPRGGRGRQFVDRSGPATVITTRATGFPPGSVGDRDSRVTKVQTFSDGTQLIHYGNFVRIADSKGVTANSSGVPYTRETAQKFIDSNAYLQKFNVEGITFGEFVRSSKQDYSFLCRYNYMIDEFELNVEKLGHAKRRNYGCAAKSDVEKK